MVSAHTSLLPPFLQRSAGLALVALSLVSTGACKKAAEGGETTPPVATDTPESTAPTEPPVEQIPDPQVLKDARAAYLRGHYEKTVSLLEPELENWQKPEEQRAAALGHAWVALALNEGVPENAEAHTTRAQELANALDEAAPKQLAAVAHGLYLLALSDLEAAHTALQAASEQGEDFRALANIALGKSLINLAFDRGEQLKYPEKLKAAKSAYEAALNGDGEDPLIVGHIEEGLAAIAKYEGNRAAQCDHARSALEAYQAVESAEILQEGPRGLQRDGSCG